MLEMLLPKHATQLAQLLKPLLPRSIFPYTWAKLYESRFYPESSEPRCLVDRWPSPNFIVTTVAEPLSDPYYIGLSVFPVAEEIDQSALDAFLNTLVSKLCSGCRERSFLFYLTCGKEDTLVQRTEEFLLSRKGTTVAPVPTLILQWAPPEVQATFFASILVPPLDFPFKIAPLKPEDAPYVRKIWEHHGYMTGERIWRDRIEHFETICLREEPHSPPVSFMLTNPLGFLTHGYTAEEYRGRQLFHHLTYPLMKTQVDKYGIVPFGLVFPHNQSSRSMSKRVGWLVETEFTTSLLLFTPNTSKL